MSEALLQPHTLDPVLADWHGASRWYVGYSGGLDSTVLLHLLQRWCRDNPQAPPLAAIHVNHGLQEAADAWQAHCSDFCQSLQVPLVTRAVVVPAGASPEAAARAERYRVFSEVLEPGAVLFLAHHRDDQVETFFLRLLRGAGVEGLAAMPAQRPLGSGTLLRPLLECERSQLERYAADQQLAFVEDPSNSNTALDRNFLRAELLPLLASRWPGYRSTVTRASAHLADAAAALAAGLGPLPVVHSTMGDPGLALKPLLAQPATAAQLLRAWLRSLGCQMPDQAALEEFLRQLQEAAPDAAPQLASGKYCLRRYRDAVYCTVNGQAEAPAQVIALQPGAAQDIPGIGSVELVPAPAAGLLLAPGEVLQLRWRRGGERCRLPGRDGHSNLKQLLQAWDVPPWWRDRVPLLYAAEEMLAIGDLALCACSRWRDAPEPPGTLWKLCWNRPSGPRDD